jgi:hypothetical protein
MAVFRLGKHVLEFEPDQYGITELSVDAYFVSLCSHIGYVQEAGRKLGIPNEQLERHDLSKLTVEEFPHYARQFHGDKGDPDGFARCWLHHIHHNPHHWNHWLFADGYTPKGSTVEKGVVEMPQHFAIEMIADWMGASRAYTGSWDMKDWLIKNMPTIKVHSKTAAYLRQELDKLGYAEIVWVQKFANEG